MQSLSDGDLNIALSQPVASVLRLDWTGKSNARQPAAVLAPYFDELIEHCASQASSLEMHFEKLEHFNSSTISALIRLVKAAKEKSVKITVFYDKKLRWQRMSFEALRVLEKAGGTLLIREC